MASTVADH
jgi:hypothetical protein